MIQQVYSHPDIYRIRVNLPDNPLQYLNAYVIKGPSGNLVIDTGFNRPECKRALGRGLQELGIRLQSDTALFITHLHADHSGLVGLFAAAGCPVYMHPIDYQYLVDSEDGSTWKAAEDNFMREGMPPEEIRTQFSNQARTFSPDPHFTVTTVQDGDHLHLAGCDLQVIHAPGHTPGLCCLYLAKEQVFFTSDHILFDITPNIQVWYHMKHALQRYLESLQKVRDLPVRLALPGHREGDTSIVGRIDEIMAHHDRRLAEICHLVKCYPHSTAYEIAPHMTWSMRGKKWKDFPPTQKWFALGETLAHIEYLVDHGTLRCCEEQGCRRYDLI
ncbi:MBL fold metallo-hydrolase [uncultured Megasphaera sp.]|uniref:MBL fold metallo-hydrolase n=1 Tax=uncultured Megasphaera sp. TaxID=165188 RepID=UPI0025928F1B|nr:MBL fold metallo-hydrolase [uncultured Megasphaera sp.]